MLLAQLEIFCTTTGRDVNDAGPLIFTYFFPGDNPVRVTGQSLAGCRQLVKGAPVLPADKIGAGQFTHDPVVADHCLVKGAFGHVVGPAVAGFDLKVSQIRANGSGDVAGQRPRGGGPDQERLPLPSQQREPDVDRVMGNFVIPIGDNFVLADAGSTTGTPGHNVSPLV